MPITEAKDRTTYLCGPRLFSTDWGDARVFLPKEAHVAPLSSDAFWMAAKLICQHIVRHTRADAIAELLHLGPRASLFAPAAPVVSARGIVSLELLVGKELQSVLATEAGQVARVHAHGGSDVFEELTLVEAALNLAHLFHRIGTVIFVGPFPARFAPAFAGIAPTRV